MILKSGSIGPGTLNGVDFGGVSLMAVIPEPSTIALAAAGIDVLAANRLRRLRRTA